MSSLYVRQTVEAWLQDPTLPLPFYPTINEEQNPADDMWVTAQFGSSYRETTTFCRDKQFESGDIEVIFFGKPGVGYTALIAQAEAFCTALLLNADSTEALVLTGRSAPFEYSAGSALKQYSVGIYIDYEYYM